MKRMRGMETESIKKKNQFNIWLYDCVGTDFLYWSNSIWFVDCLLAMNSQHLLSSLRVINMRSHEAQLKAHR